MDVAQAPSQLDGNGCKKCDTMALERCVKGTANEMNLVVQRASQVEGNQRSSEAIRQLMPLISGNT